MKPITREEIQARTNEQLMDLVRDRMIPYIKANKKDEEIVHKGSPQLEKLLILWVFNIVLWKVFMQLVSYLEG